jgi:predicted transcriptional regulator
MMDNLYDQDEMKETAADVQPAAVSHVQPDNFFAETAGEAPARPGANETIVPKTTPGRSWRDELMDGVSLDNARESARARTEAEKKHPRVETPEEASFWGSAEHALGNQNIEAFADSMDHLADWSGDKWWARKASTIRDSLKKDGSSYRPIYESYKQIGGLKDAWGYVKETVGNQVGVMAPSILGAAALGGIGASQGELVGGKTGAVVGGTVGGMAGAAMGTIHLQVSDMRQALKREGLEGEDLVKYTNMGAAILTSLDMAFPALQAAKLGGFARKQISEKVAQKLVQNLVQGGKMRTAAEFTKQFGKEVIKDAVLLEVPTELAQEALTELGAKKMAGKNVTAADVQKFALETAPEIALRTLIGAGGMALPGAGAQAYRDVRDAHKAAEFPGDKPSTGTEATGPDAPPQAPIDGSPEPGIQPPMEDPSREVAPNPAAGAKGQGVIRFIQSIGGMQPSGELDALDAHRYPGLINQGGKSADEMREALVEAGYLEESGPDQPNITTPDDVYDLIQRAISGERIVPLQDQQADADFHAALETKDAEKELNWAEKQFVLPAIEHYDEEAGDPILSQAYRKLSPDERIQVIDRVRRGEDVFNVVEEIFTYNVNTEVVAAMVQAYGPNPELVERIRTMIAQQQPDLLVGFDDMVAQFPTRRPKVAREPVRRAGDEPTELVRGLGGRLKAIAGDAQAFNIALGEIERDRKILKDDAFRIASDFLGQPPKKGTKASYFQAIRDAQANPGATAPANVEQTSAKLSKEPAVPAQQSATPEAITSLIDGSRHVDLTKHLDKLGISVEDYARNYRLAQDYPLVAENAVAERHGKTRQTEDFETYKKKFTIGGVIKAKEEYEAQIRKAAAAPVAEMLDVNYPEDLAGAKKRLADKPETLKAISAMEAAGRELRSKIEAGDPDIRGAAQRFAEAGRHVDEIGAKEGATAAVVRLATQNAKSAGRQLPLPKGETVKAVDLAKPDAQAEAAPERDLMAELIKLANSKTPRDEWGAALGLQPFELNTAITQAVQAGILAYDKRGVARRAPMDQVKDAKGIVAEFEALLDEAMPTEKINGIDVPIAAGVNNWSARAQALLAQIGRISLADAQAIAPRLLGYKVAKSKLSSRPKIIALAAERIASLAGARHKAAATGGRTAAFVAPGTFANENVMLTPEAESKAEALQRVVDDAVAGILPASVRVDVVANIEIGRLAREDELYALRSSRPDIMSDTEVSDELSDDSRKAGEEGDGASESGAPAGTAATRGGGFATGETGGEGRILRQESATLRSDGSIFVGRPVGASRPADARARDAAASQPIGSFARFDADGFVGVVSAATVTDHQSLAARNARPSEYRLATLTYRLYDPSAPITDEMLGKNFKPDFRAGGEHYTPHIWARVSQHMDGTWEVSMVQRLADRESAPKGMADKLYAAIEKDLGIKMSPSGILSEQGYAMWQKRSPGSVKWHQWSNFEGYYISPRRIKDNLDFIGKELRAIAARAPTTEEAEFDKQLDLKNARKERAELIKLWTKMPVEARAETPNMFSLTAYHGTPYHFDRFDMGRLGTGEGAQAYGWGLYFAENKSIADYYRETLTTGRNGPSALIVGGETVDTNDFSVLQWIARELSIASDQQVDGVFPGDVLDDLERIILENKSEPWFREDLSLDTLEPDEERATIQSGLDLLKRLEGKAVKFPRDEGALYQVEIDAEPEQLLDWDAPLSKQPAKVKEAIRSLGFDPVEYREGKWLYNELAHRRLEGPAEASSALRKAGIPGLRYRDAASRDITMNGKPVPGNLSMWAQMKMDGSLDEAEAGHHKALENYQAKEISESEAKRLFSTVDEMKERFGETIARLTKELAEIEQVQKADIEQAEGTRNIVAFDDSIIKITHKNGEPMTAAERQAAVDELFSLNSDDESTGPANVRALGQTDPYAEAISIGARAIEEKARKTGQSMADIAKTTARHEALEFFLAQGLINPSEWSALQAAARKQGWVDQTGVREAYTAHYGKTMGPRQLNDLILKESIMEMYGRYRADQFTPKGVVRIVFKRISDFLDRLANSIKGQGFQTWEDIFRKVDEGELKRRYEEIYGRTDQPNTQAMIRAGVLPDARGIPTAPGATRAVQPHAPKGVAQQIVQRFLPRQRPLKALSELMKDFKVAAGLPVRTGRTDPALQRQATAAGGGQVQGQYNGVARLRVQIDFDTFSHEAGHHIERLLGGRLTVAMNAFSHELLPLAGIVAGNQNTMLREGFAEFFRRYLTNEAAARAQAPGFYRAFENLVEAENPRLFWTLQDIQDEYDNFLMGDPLDRGAAQQTVLTRPTSATRRFFQDAERDGFVSTMADRLYDLHHGFVQNVFDKRHGWWMATRGLLNEIERLTGQRVTLNAADNPNKLIRMTSHTQAWAMQDLKEGIALRGRPNGGRVSMHQVLATAFGGTAQSAWNEARARAFGDYLIARRAVLLYVRYRPQFRVQIQQFVAANPQMGFLLARLPNNAVSDLPNPPTAEPLYEHLNRLLRHEQQNPQFRQAAELYYSFNKDMIQLLYEKGLITLEEKNEYQQDRDYCPFQRNMEDRERVDTTDNQSKRPPRGRDKANKYDVYRAIEGSMRDIINPIQSTVQSMFEIRLRAAINDTLAAMDRVARQAGQAGNEIFERLPPTEARAVEVRIREQLRQAARAAGMTATDTAIMLTNVESQIGQNVVTSMFTQSQASEKGEKIVWFFENGKPIPAQLPDGTLGQMMFHGLTAVGQRNMGQIMEAAATISGVARVGVTFSFGFMIRNIITDSIASAVNSPYARPVLTQAAGMREIISGGRYLHLYNRYAGMMGGAGHAALSDQSLERDIHALRQRGFNVRVPRSIRDLVKMVFQLGEFSETATRVGIFRNAMISAERDGMSRFDAAIEAAHYAHDVMDFSQHGSKTEAFRRVIPFFNAALQGIYKYGKTLTAANDYGNLIQIWDRQMRGQPLSRNEQRALGQAGKAWLISTVGLGAMSLIFCLLGADDDDMKEVPDSIRATHWMLSINGVLHLLPKDMRVFLAGEDERTDWMLRIPKPFEIGWFANAVERTWDYLRNSDPNAASGMASDFFTTVMPPHSIAAADLVYGFVFGKDMYSGNDIVPIWEKGPNEIERKEQYGPYTSWAARQIGEALNMSPYYAEFIIRNLTTSVGQDAAAGIDAALGEGPELSIAEYPAARRFTYNSGKSSQSLGKFYNMMTDGEGLSKWFWDTFSSDARSFHSAGNTYGKMIDAGGENSAIAAEFLGRINPDQRVFAVLSNDFKGRTKGKYRNLHPMINAEEGVKIANAIMKEVVSGELIMDKGEKGEERKKMDREQMRFARNEVGHIRKGMAQNALQITGVDGWREQKLMDVDARLATLKAGAPEVYSEMMRRLKEKKFQDGKHLAKVWGKVRERVDSQRKDADLGDLYGPVIGE